MKLDLNCDLGEGESLARMRGLMRWVTSVNMACGGHAGNVAIILHCARLAKQFGLRFGAHPGPWTREDKGRGAVRIQPDELELLLLHQVGAFECISRNEGMRLHHIKLHGALYHASEADPALGQSYVDSVRRWWPAALIYASAGGNVARLARRSGVRVWEEAFADRGYRPDGTLVPRTEPEALLTTAASVRARVKTLLHQHEVVAVDGTGLRMRPRTLCIHSDTPHSVILARLVSRVLAGVAQHSHSISVHA